MALKGFDLIGERFADNGTLDDSLDITKYRTGWGFLGADPPLVGQFNLVQNVNDDRFNWIFAQFQALATANGLTLNAGDTATLATIVGALALRNSPQFTGAPSAPTPPDGSVNMRLATTEFVSRAISIAVGRMVKVTVFTSAGTFVPQADTKTLIVEAVGAGGGGGAGQPTTTSTSCGGGGGSGAYAKAMFTRSQVEGGVAVTIGFGGSGGTVGNFNGFSGTATSFGGLILCPGGRGGQSLIGVDPATSGGYDILSVVAPGLGADAPTIVSGYIASSRGHPGAVGFCGPNQMLSGSGGASHMSAGGSLGGALPGTGFYGADSPSHGGGGAGGGTNRINATYRGGGGGYGKVIVYEYS